MPSADSCVVSGDPQLLCPFPFVRLMKPSPFTCWMTINCWEMLKTISFPTETDFFRLDCIPGVRTYAHWVKCLPYTNFLSFVYLPLFPLVWVSIRLTLFCVFFFPSAFFVFRTPYSYRSRMSLFSISEAKWCCSCLNDEAASEILSWFQS